MNKYRLREVREEYNDINADTGQKLTIECMATYCSTNISTISRIETGKTEPTADILIKYADAFGVTVDYLLGRSNAKDVKNCTISSELGLSDSAIETLKFIKEKISDEDYDISDFISAFIGSGQDTLIFFDKLYNALSAEYGFLKYNEQEKSLKDRDSLILVQEMTNETMKYIKCIVQPKLEKAVKRDYEAVEQHAPYLQ